jgi:hypothetical protein
MARTRKLMEKREKVGAALGFFDQRSANISPGELLAAYEILLAADEELKSSRVAEDLVLQGVVERLIQGDRKRAAAG